MPLTFGSLFAGIGGADLGLERAGLVCRWQVEINPYCRRVLAKHWPGVARHDDVRTFPPPGGDWRVDLIVGGDPCQGNSKAGAIHKKAHEDLGSELLRVVATLRPTCVLRENPYPHRPDALWPWWRMRRGLEALGYAVLPFRLRSCCLGAHHRRDRVWLLGHLADADRLADAVQGRGPAAGAAGEVPGEVRQQRVRPDAGAAPGGAGRAERRDHRLPAPRVCRSRNEVPHLVDRVAALGNAIDPVCAEWIGRTLLAAIADPDPEGVTCP